MSRVTFESREARDEECARTARAIKFWKERAADFRAARLQGLINEDAAKLCFTIANRQAKRERALRDELLQAKP